MISGKEAYEVLASIVPLYVAMILAYASVRWCKIFTPDQCLGINSFVAVFAVPLLSFHFISSNDPYTMDYLFIVADSLQKIVILLVLLAWLVFFDKASLEWTITLFSLSTLPNTLVMGIPLLKAMYGESSANLMVQIVVLQSIIWYTLMLVMFEYRGAKLLIAEQFPETAEAISLFRVESDVVSLNGREALEMEADIGDDGKLHVVVRRSSSGASSFVSHGWNSDLGRTLRPSNLTGVEIYSVDSSLETTPRPSNFNQAEFYTMFSKATTLSRFLGYASSFHGMTPRASNYEVDMAKMRRVKSMSGEIVNFRTMFSYPNPNLEFSGSRTCPGKNDSHPGGGTVTAIGDSGANNKDVQHMFLWSSSSPAVSDGNIKHATNGRSDSSEFDGGIDHAIAGLKGARSKVTFPITQFRTNDE